MYVRRSLIPIIELIKSNTYIKEIDLTDRVIIDDNMEYLDRYTIGKLSKLTKRGINSLLIF